MLLLSLEGLKDRAYSLSVICPEEGPLKAQIEKLRIPTYTVQEVTARFTYNPLRLTIYACSVIRVLKQLRRIVVGRTPLCLHANSVRAGLVVTIATVGLRIPIIWHIHDMLPDHPVTWMMRLVAHASSRSSIVACSYAAAETLKPIWGRGGIPSVIHNGVDLRKLAPKRLTRDEKRLELGLPVEAYVIGCVGMISERKAQIELIKAVSIVASTLPHLRVLIVGSPLFDGDHLYLARVKAEARQRGLDGVITFLGQRSDVVEVMQALDLLVLTSRKEPFGLVVLEAMALGKVVVATDSGGPRELIKSGVNGFLVPVGDVNKLGATILMTAQSPALQKSCAAQALLVRERFGMGRYIDEWDQLYRSIEREPSGRRPKIPAAPELVNNLE